jgi:predicted nucleotidyltransferase component of viral defense system
VIQRAHITEWRAKVPWALDEQVEQDLIVSRALVDLYSEEVLRREVAFRGGTALHKLYLGTPARYSEDIDLVQVEAGGIGAVMDAVHRSLDSWLGKPQWKHGQGRVTFYYRYATEIEPVQQRRLKVEINTREHFCVHGLVQRHFDVTSRWWSGQAEITTYDLDELMATKLRALYQRRKGRDLFDLWIALRLEGVDPKRIVQAFSRYMEAEGNDVSRGEFEKNLAAKVKVRSFVDDLRPLLAQGTLYDVAEAAALVEDRLLALL